MTEKIKRENEVWRKNEEIIILQDASTVAKASKNNCVTSLNDLPERSATGSSQDMGHPQRFHGPDIGAVVDLTRRNSMSTSMPENGLKLNIREKRITYQPLQLKIYPYAYLTIGGRGGRGGGKWLQPFEVIAYVAAQLNASIVQTIIGNLVWGVHLDIFV